MVELPSCLLEAEGCVLLLKGSGFAMEV